MFPSPCLFALVLVECVDALHEQATLPARSQTNIDFIQATRSCVRCEQVHQSLSEPREEHGVLDRLRAAGHLILACGIMEEHEIEIGSISEFEAAELSIRDDDRMRGAHIL